MSLDLNKLENKLDEALIKETTETLTKFLNDKRMTNNKQQTAVEQIKQFLYSEICERRDYSASRMCEEVIKFIEQINTGGNNGEITTVNNIPDTNTNTSTTGNLSGNMWGGDTTSTTWGGDTSNNKIYDSNTWMFHRKMVDENVNRIKAAKQIWDKEKMAEYINKIEAEKQIWDKTVNWDIMNKHTRVNDEEQAPYNVKTNVVTSGKTDDGTIAVIEITIDIKQR